MQPAPTEQRLLLLSAVITLLLAIAGVAIGLISGAKAIIFDGVYSLADAGLTMVAFFAARLIAKGADRKFQYGYWHIEPILSFVNGSVLLIACVYALIDGVGTALAGGSEVSFGPGIIYAGVSVVICTGMHVYVRLRSRGIGSTLLELDASAWLFSGALSGGLCIAFIVAKLLEGSEAAGYGVYFDPIILIVLALSMAPMPLKTIITAGQEILQIAPADLDSKVRKATDEVASRHGFLEHRSYVTRVGRAHFVEIGFVGPSTDCSFTLGELDTIRQEVVDALGGTDPAYWVTIGFTSDARWI